MTLPTIIVGITGTLGAGKGAIVRHLGIKGFRHYSVREFLINEIKKRRLPINRDSMNMIGEELRHQFGASFIIDELHKKAIKNGGNAVIESVRAVGEVDSLKKKRAFLLAVDADPRVRYERIVNRGSETDSVSYEKFIADEERESRATDPAQMNIRECIKRADFVIWNDTTLENLHHTVDDVLERLQVV